MNNVSYDYFTQGDSQKQPYVDNDDQTLCYTTGYANKDQVYTYFVPFFVQNNLSANATKYTLEANVKIGGMIKTVSQDFILVADDFIATAGTAQWGLINYAYTQQYGETYDGDRNFFRSIAASLTGTISTQGSYKFGSNWQTVISDSSSLTNLLYNAESILKYLPNITGIDLSGASSLTSSTENIVNIDLSNIKDLRKFYIENCSSLTGTYDLSSYENLEEVDASGTTVNVLIPTNSKVTKYELGTPTTVSIINPTVLTPAGVSATSGASIDSLTIINVPDAKTFSTFNKIMNV